MFDGEPTALVQSWYLPGAIGSTDYQLMTAASCLLLASSPPPNRAPEQLRASRASDEPPPHKRIPECLLLGECRIGNRLGILGKWASRQLVGLSHAGGSQSQMEQDEQQEDGRPDQQPLSQSQSQAPGLSHTREVAGYVAGTPAS